jgi:hypothetical protein
VKGITLLESTLQASESTVKAAAAVSWDLAAFGVVQIAEKDLPSVRRAPAAGQTGFLPANLLKHSDDQTVAGVAAVCRALQTFQLDPTSFSDWGVLGAPRFLGRSTMAGALKKFFADGAWNVSPHLIPNQTLHSLSGTVSIALNIHGPNFGVGGGPDSESEGLLAAAALLSQRKLPGVWLVLTGWDPEPVADADGRNRLASVCTGVALALTPDKNEWQGARLRLIPGKDRANANGHHHSKEAPALFSVEKISKALANPGTGTHVWRLQAGGWVEFESGNGGEKASREP